MDIRSNFCSFYLLGVVLLCLAADSLSKSVKSDKEKVVVLEEDAETDKKEFFAKKCVCKVKTEAGDLLHDFGTIDTYSFPESSCHKVHHRCRKSCAAKLELKGHIHEHATYGFHYCDAYGSVTPKGGVKIVAQWEARGCPHHDLATSKKSVELCCGHTTLPLAGLRDQQALTVFGWNPDCKAQTFVVAE